MAQGNTISQKGIGWVRSAYRSRRDSVATRIGDDICCRWLLMQRGLRLMGLRRPLGYHVQVTRRMRWDLPLPAGKVGRVVQRDCVYEKSSISGFVRPNYNSFQDLQREILETSRSFAIHVRKIPSSFQRYLSTLSSILRKLSHQPRLSAISC